MQNDIRHGLRNVPIRLLHRALVVLFSIALTTAMGCNKAPTAKDETPGNAPSVLLSWEAISGEQFAKAQPTKPLAGVNGTPELLLRRDQLKSLKSELAGLQSQRRALKGELGSLKPPEILAGLQSVANVRSKFDSLLLALLQHRYATMQHYLLDKHGNEEGYEGYAGACFGFFINTSSAAEKDLKRRLGEILSTVNEAAKTGTHPTKVELESLLGSSTDVEQWAKTMDRIVQTPKEEPSQDNIQAFALSAIVGMEVYEELADLTFRRMFSSKSFDEALKVTENALFVSYDQTRKEIERNKQGKVQKDRPND